MSEDEEFQKGLINKAKEVRENNIPYIGACIGKQFGSNKWHIAVATDNHWMLQEVPELYLNFINDFYVPLCAALLKKEDTEDYEGI